MALTILELCDLAQEVLINSEMDDLPVYLRDERGALIALREDFFSVRQVESGFVDDYSALVIQV